MRVLYEINYSHFFGGGWRGVLQWCNVRAHKSRNYLCLCYWLSTYPNVPVHTDVATFDLFALCIILLQKGKHWGVFTGFQARSKDLRGGRWSWTLTFAQKRSWVGRWSWAEQVGRLLLRVVQAVRQQRCNGHCLSDSVQHSSWKSNCAVHKWLGNGEGTPP